MVGSSLANSRGTHTTELEDFLCCVLELRLWTRIQICWVWPWLSPQTEVWSSTVEQLHSVRGAQRAAADGGRQLSSLHFMQGSEVNSGSQQHVKFAARCKRFSADCVTLSFLRRKQGNSALFAWVSHPSPWLRTHCAVRWTAPFWFTALIMFYSRNMVLMSKLMGKILLRSNNIL